MEVLKYICIGVLAVSALVILAFAIKSKKFFKVLFLNAFLGVFFLAVINLTTAFTGVSIPVNEYTVSGSAVFGIPALCGFLIFKFIFV